MDRSSRNKTPLVVAGALAVLLVLGGLTALVVSSGGSAPAEPVAAEPRSQASGGSGDALDGFGRPIVSEAEIKAATDAANEAGAEGVEVDMSDAPLPEGAAGQLDPSANTPGGGIDPSSIPAVGASAVTADCMAAANGFFNVLEPALADPNGERLARAALADAEPWCDKSVVDRLRADLAAWIETRAQLGADAPDYTPPVAPVPPGIPPIEGPAFKDFSKP